MVVGPSADPIYIYYKIYDDELEKGPSEIRHPIYSNDPYTGRVDATRIPPPHTVVALIRCICKKEGKGIGFDWDNDDAYSTVLYKTISSPTSYDLRSFAVIPLLNSERPGSTLLEPVILQCGYAEIRDLFPSVFR